MSGLEELQGRISAAMERVGRGIDNLVPAGAHVDPEELAQLVEALDTERLTNAQLQSRLAALRDKHGQERAADQETQKSLQNAASGFELDLQRLRAANEQLRHSNAALRAANAEGLADNSLIDAAQGAEIESLRALLSAERAEADAVLAQLAQLLDPASHGTENAAQGEEK